MPNRLSIVGERRGRLEVLEMIYGGRNARVRCRCDCGGEIVALAYNFRNGNTASCGCLAQEHRSAQGRRQGAIQGKLNATHGMSRTPTYIAWLEARKRCFNPKNKRYPYYGARGITMCQRWAESFDAFLADMGKRPDSALSLDRINNEGNYEPGNCRWATKLTQARNTRRVRTTWAGACEMRSRHAAGERLTDLAREFGMCHSNAQMIVTFKTWKTSA